MSCNWLFSWTVRSHAIVSSSTETTGSVFTLGSSPINLHLEKHCILISFIHNQRDILNGFLSSHMLIILLSVKLMKRMAIIKFT